MTAPKMKGKTILVTGGAGFLGSHVVDRAMSEGADIYVVDSFITGTRANIEHHFGHPRFHFIQHDVQYPFPHQIEKVKFDFIFHMACPASPVHYQTDPIATTMTCVNGTLNSLRTAMRCDCPVLICSTSEVYGDPAVHPQPETYWGNVSCTGVRSCYDEGKRVAESLCFDFNRLHGVKIRVARIFNTYGPRMCFNDGRIISNFVVQALKGENITVYGTGEYTRSFQFCKDLVEGFWRLIQHPTEIGPVNLGNPEEYKVIEMAQMIKELCKSSSEIVFMEAAKDDPKQRKPDITKAKAVLGWEPQIRVEEGLRRTKEEFASRLAASRSAAAKLYVQCNPLLDISAHVDASFLKKYNLKPASACLVAPEQMPLFDELEANGAEYIPGGSGLNTARVAQWMSCAPKGVFATFVGCVADDKYGHILKENAEGGGLRMLLQYTKKVGTGTCGVCVCSKERSLVCNIGAAGELSREFLESERVQNTIHSCKIFYLTGFAFVSSPLDFVMNVAKHCAAVNGKLVLNLSASYIITGFTDSLHSVLPYVDFLISNEDEARLFADVEKWGTKDLKVIAAKAAAMPVRPGGSRTVIFTQGKEPVVWAANDHVNEAPVPLVDSKLLVDTNGAGDAFVGGLLAGLALGHSVQRSIEGGNYAAGVVIQHSGCSFPEKPSWRF